MAAKTTVKVATTNAAAKDDFFTLGENQDGWSLDVLANDPGSATLFSVGAPTAISTTSGQMLQTSSGTFAFTGSNGVSGTGNMSIVNGQVKVDLGGFDADTLQAGETITFSVTYTAKMANGVLSTAVANVTITGENDAASISVVPGGDYSVTEHGSAVAGDPDASGKLKVVDIDHDQSVFQTPASLAGTYGSFTFNAATGEWTYHLNDGAADSLYDGQQVTDTLTVTSLDGTATQNIVVNITGSNDAPTITAADSTGGVTEDAEATSVSGQITASDVDTGDVLSYAVTAGASDYGTFSVDADGKWTFAIDNAAAQSLGAGATDVAVFTITVSDDHGGSVTQDVTITVTGTNDKPTITVADSTGGVTEDGTQTATGPCRRQRRRRG
jgi:VCBS repeat-containing protein